MKTNKEKNLEHDAKMATRARPKLPVYDFEPLTAVIHAWITDAK